MSHLCQIQHGSSRSFSNQSFSHASEAQFSTCTASLFSRSPAKLASALPLIGSEEKCDYIQLFIPCKHWLWDREVTMDSECQWVNVYAYVVTGRLILGSYPCDPYLALVRVHQGASGR